LRLIQAAMLTVALILIPVVRRKAAQPPELCRLFFMCLILWG